MDLIPKKIAAYTLATWESKCQELSSYVEETDDLDTLDQISDQIEALLATVRKMKPEFSPPVNYNYKLCLRRIGQLTPKERGRNQHSMSDQDDKLARPERDRRSTCFALAEGWELPELGEYIQKPTTSVKRCVEKVRLHRAKKKGRRSNKAIKNEILYGAFQDISEKIDANSIELIFTDPPWDAETVPAYGELAEIGKRVLIPGGSILAYASSQMLNKIIPEMCIDGLRYYGICCDVRMSPAEKLGRMQRSGVYSRILPLVWMVKGSDRYDTSVWIEDAVLSPAEKDTHKWQQSSLVAEYYIQRLTTDKGCVFDPFCGGATTAVTARKLGRSFITCDIDEGAIDSATRRLTDAIGG